MNAGSVSAGSVAAAGRGGDPADPGRRRARALVLSGVALVAACLLGLCVGAVALPLPEVLATLAQQIPLVRDLPPIAAADGLTGVDATILLQLRAPRIVLAALVGGTLAMAGAAYQGVFRNPLADPYLLGAAAGAGLGATLVISLSPVRALGPLGVVPIAAFVGALVGVALAYVIGSAAQREGTGGATLLLAGVAVASFLTAVQTVVQQAHSDSLREVYGWILGQLGAAGWSSIALITPYVVACVLVLSWAGRSLDLLAVGDEEAHTLGVNPGRVRFVVLAAASLGTAAAVAMSGLIGFVGLVVPHVVRRLAGASYRVVLPVSLLAGGAFLVLADLVARTVVAPAELPIGVVTAFVGAPFFAALLRVAGSASQ